jgi:hypothetical protein
MKTFLLQVIILTKHSSLAWKQVFPGNFPSPFISEWKIGVIFEENLITFHVTSRERGGNNEQSLKAIICWLISSSFVVCYRFDGPSSIHLNKLGDKMIINNFRFVSSFIVASIFRRFTRRWFSFCCGFPFNLKEKTNIFGSSMWKRYTNFLSL